MATVNKNIFGSVSGKVGNLVFRKFNGKTVVSIRPDRYKKSNSPKAKSARDRFAAVVKLSSRISKIPPLAESWKYTSLKGSSPYMKILNANLALTENPFLTTNNIITPTGFRNPVLRVELQKEKLVLVSQILKNEVRRFSKPVDVHLIFYFLFETSNGKYHTEFDSLLLKGVFIDTELEFTLSPRQVNVLNCSCKAVLFVVVTSEVTTKNGYVNSTSLAFELKTDVTK